MVAGTVCSATPEALASTALLKWSASLTFEMRRIIQLNKLRIITDSYQA